MNSICSEIAGITSDEMLETDIRIVTSGGLCIPAHSSILVSMSTVFENIIIDRPNQRKISAAAAANTIPILGVPCDAVVAFVRFLYTSRCREEEMDGYGIHLLALSHLYSLHPLKQMCTKAVGKRLVIENVVDVLQLARLCDAPDLYLKCLKMLSANFVHVQTTQGWNFLEDHDPCLELEILQFLDEFESRKKRRRMNKEQRNVYTQLSEAMKCLEHICTDGCTSVGPHDMEPNQYKEPCDRFSTCHGLQQLIRHFATCKKRVKGECCRCKRMWQLLRLHSATCDETNECKVPLCRQFKLKMHLDTRRGEEDGKWKLLARKVVSAKAMSSLSSSNRKEALW